MRTLIDSQSGNLCSLQLRQNREAASAYADKASDALRAGDLASVKRAVSSLLTSLKLDHRIRS